jgi:uncharacterized protein
MELMSKYNAEWPAIAAMPIQPNERIATLDILRGVALLGIFMVNVPAFNASLFAGTDGAIPVVLGAWYDRVTAELANLLLVGKFNALFSFLFAVGFTIQLERLERSNPGSARAIYLRKLAILFGIGLIHGCVFWPGDVLHKYALLGLLLFGLRRLSDRAVVGIAAGTPLFPLLAVGLLLMVVPASAFEHQREVAGAWEASNNVAFGHGSFLDAVQESARMMRYYYSHPATLYISLKFYVELIATMCLGLVVGRRRWIQDAAKNDVLIRRIQYGSLAVAVITGTVQLSVDLSNHGQQANWVYIIGNVFMRYCRMSLMVFYATTIIRMAGLRAWQGIFRPIALAGRMPLTNYLMQTAMALPIFYGWGLGLWGKAGPLACILVAVGLYAGVQLPFSCWWLSRFRYGPVEYLWRAMTYGSVPTIRLSEDAARA